jgi:hypothetical protein
MEASAGLPKGLALLLMYEPEFLYPVQKLLLIQSGDLAVLHHKFAPDHH